MVRIPGERSAGCHDVSRRRLIRRAAGLSLSLLGGMLLDALGPADTLVRRSRTASTVWGASASHAQTPPDPDELHHWLLSTPFEPGELPSGFTINPPANRRTGSGMQAIEPSLRGLIGAALAELRGPDLTNVIWYYVFATDADALFHFEYGELGRSTTGGGGTAASQSAAAGLPVGTKLHEAYTPPGIDLPAWCVAAKTGPWGWTTCSVLVGSVEVVGYSKALPGTGANRGSDANAIALARAGVTHLMHFFITGLPLIPVRHDLVDAEPRAEEHPDGRAHAARGRR